MKAIAILEYMFMFNPDNTWATGSKFERDLADFFSAHGYDAEVLDTRGGSNRRVIALSKIEDNIDLFRKDKQVGPQKALQIINKSLK